jgi:hypothetical protein
MKDITVCVLRIKIGGKWVDVMAVTVFAKYLRVTRNRVYQYIDAGMPVITPGEGYKAWIPVKKALAWVEKNIHEYKNGR